MIQHDSPLFVMQFCLYNKSADLLIHYLIATCGVEKFQVELIAFLDIRMENMVRQKEEKHGEE